MQVIRGISIDGSISSRSFENIEQDVNPACVLDWFNLTLSYLLAKCNYIPDGKIAEADLEANTVAGTTASGIQVQPNAIATIKPTDLESGDIEQIKKDASDF